MRGQPHVENLAVTLATLPRAIGRRSDANNAPKAARAGDRGFETGQKIRNHQCWFSIIWRIPVRFVAQKPAGEP
jgi:hypothetical protein